MRKVNPLYFVLTCFVLMLTSIFFMNYKKNHLDEQIVYLKNIQKNADIFNELNTKWGNSFFVNKKINEIVKSGIYKNEKILKISSKDSIKISLESKNQEKLNKFLNEILNNQFIVKELKVEDRFVEFQIGVDK